MLCAILQCGELMECCVRYYSVENLWSVVCDITVWRTYGVLTVRYYSVENLWSVVCDITVWRTYGVLCYVLWCFDMDILKLLQLFVTS